MKVLIGDANLVMVQFSLPNTKMLPEGLFEREEETSQIFLYRKVTSGSGDQVIPTTSRVALGKLLSQIEANCYTLISCTTQKRIGENNKPYHTVRFLLLRSDLVKHVPADHYPFFVAFANLVAQGFWRVRVFRNRDLGTDVSRISINLEYPKSSGKAKFVFKAEKGNLILEPVV